MIIRGVITACVLVALTLASFGHRALPPSDEAKVQAYVLAGGDWAELCRENGDPFASVAQCMACTIAQGCVVPDPSNIGTVVPNVAAIMWSAQEPLTTRAATSIAHLARAPPVG
jgi:hypothetical protein